jgi:hypothetical protein
MYLVNPAPDQRFLFIFPRSLSLHNISLFYHFLNPAPTDLPGSKRKDGWAESAHSHESALAIGMNSQSAPASFGSLHSIPANLSNL